MSSSVRRIFLSRNSSLCPVSLSSNQSILESCVTCNIVVPYTRSTGKENTIEEIHWEYIELESILQPAKPSPLTDPTQQSPGKLVITSPSQEILYVAHKWPSTAPILRHMNAANTLQFYLFNIYFDIMSRHIPRFFQVASLLQVSPPKR
jgi:hypothetical protein